LRYKLEKGRMRCVDLDEDEPLPAALKTGVKAYDKFKHKPARQ
jgi:hypothetical protein